MAFDAPVCTMVRMRAQGPDSVFAGGASPAPQWSYGNAFVGRADDLEELRALFARGVRLATLVGPPGIGKTRLAREFLAVSATTASPAIACDLGDARDLDGVCSSLAFAADVSLAGASTRIAAIEHLGRTL